VLLGWLGLLALATPGLLNLKISTSTDSVLDRSDPAWAFYEASKELFGGDEVLVVALRSEVPFDPVLLAAVDDLSSELEAVPGVRSVDSYRRFRSFALTVMAP
jgi:predicted RND superfamily exporter protein